MLTKIALLPISLTITDGIIVYQAVSPPRYPWHRVRIVLMLVLGSSSACSIWLFRLMSSVSVVVSGYVSMFMSVHYYTWLFIPLLVHCYIVLSSFLVIFSYSCLRVSLILLLFSTSPLLRRLLCLLATCSKASPFFVMAVTLSFIFISRVALPLIDSISSPFCNPLSAAWLQECTLLT